MKGYRLKDLITFTHLIYGKGLFEALAASVENWEELLDSRERPSFDNAWISNFKTLQGISYQEPNSEANVTVLREFAFKEMFRLTADAEIAGYISDDIGLLAEALAKGHLTTWCEKLLASYQSGHFPC
ncbi:hypothetical protein CXG50_07430 [Pseudomonas plecoglossicida]|uniref:Uncharacterized protein n=2 Tax=Pseudomonas putida group TaxID=136845 RepID=A0ABX4UB50_PSEDL|nr:hypothetical protein HB13667_19675 [Pseudomonas putida]MDM1712224.1 hypothetical protein [Pseudomonas sp. 165]PLP92955.1 hypothetical protein CX682_08220 [Pseudomonas sp. FFUP_PS_41]PLU87356.1 hypothetical protein CXG44_10950 [Pseudomonas plecoglossicida]PZR28151.1 MAG: hypothetical protein DI538_25085 [Azospira oryzae]QKK97289.1 hypothetical protein GEV38_15515 [Pseudomonas sp. 13159349]QNT38973.1 hypothetical protein ICJ54_15580 [Pseudomonas asiatica]